MTLLEGMFKQLLCPQCKTPSLDLQVKPAVTDSGLDLQVKPVVRDSGTNRRTGLNSVLMAHCVKCDKTAATSPAGETTGPDCGATAPAGETTGPDCGVTANNSGDFGDSL